MTRTEANDYYDTIPASRLAEWDRMTLADHQKAKANDVQAIESNVLPEVIVPVVKTQIKQREAFMVLAF